MEMINPWTIYLYGIYHSVLGTISVITFLLWTVLIGFGIVQIGHIINETASTLTAKFYRARRNVVVATIVFTITSTLLPSRDILVAMFSVQPVKAAISKAVDSNRTNIAVDTLDNYIKYLHTKSEELLKKR